MENLLHNNEIQCLHGRINTRMLTNIETMSQIYNNINNARTWNQHTWNLNCAAHAQQKNRPLFQSNHYQSISNWDGMWNTLKAAWHRYVHARVRAKSNQSIMGIYFGFLFNRSRHSGARQSYGKSSSSLKICQLMVLLILVCIQYSQGVHKRARSNEMQEIE